MEPQFTKVQKDDPLLGEVVKVEVLLICKLFGN